MVDIRLFGVNCARSGHSQGLPPSSSTASPFWDDRHFRRANPRQIQTTATSRSSWTPTKVPSFTMTIHSSCLSARKRGCGLWFVGNHTRQGEVTRRKAGSRSWRTSASKASQDSVQAKCDMDHATSFGVFNSLVPANSPAPTNVTARAFPFREPNSTKSS